MSNQECKHKECARKSKVDKRIEEIRAELEEVLERLGQIEVGETWMKTWRTRK
jgi:hypothetical protein